MESKRSLTEDEIKGILSFIHPLPGIPGEIGDAVASNQFENHAKQLRTIQLYPSKIPEMKKRLESLFFKSQIEAGKSVGALSSSSIGEKNTQSTLSSFHQAGQSKVELLVGVPRLEEIIGVTKDIKTPSMEVHLSLPKDQLVDLFHVKRIAQELFEYKEIISFLLDYDMQNNREIAENEEVWYAFHRTFQNCEFESCTWSVRLTFDTTLLYSYKKKLISLAEIIESNYGDAYCIVSPDNIGIIDVYLSTNNLGDIDAIVDSIKSTRKKGKKKEEDDDDDLIMLIDDDNKEYYFIRDLVIPSIIYLPVGGIEGIKKCYFQEDKDGTWYVTTKGSNLRAILSHPLVNMKRTTSNHLWDNFEVFGIEGTRTYLKRELNKLIFISDRHLDLLNDCMLSSGRPQAVSRYGIDRTQVGVLAKMAFEQPFDEFLRSAAISETEDMSGVSASITVGNVPVLGSGYMKMVDAKTDKLIDVDQEYYNYHQKLLAMLKSESSASQMGPRIQPHQVPRNMATDIKLGGMSISRPVTNPVIPPSTGRKSVLNSKIKPAPFIPTIPVQTGNKNFHGTVTRIVIQDPVAVKELDILNRPSQIVFHGLGGKVVEREVEMY